MYSVIEARNREGGKEGGKWDCMEAGNEIQRFINMLTTYILAFFIIQRSRYRQLTAISPHGKGRVGFRQR